MLSDCSSLPYLSSTQTLRPRAEASWSLTVSLICSSNRLALSWIGRELLEAILKEAEQLLWETAWQAYMPFGNYGGGFPDPTREEEDLLNAANRAHQRFWLDVALVHRLWYPLARRRTFKNLELGVFPIGPRQERIQRGNYPLRSKSPTVSGEIATFADLLTVNPTLGSFVSDCKVEAFVRSSEDFFKSSHFPHLAELDMRIWHPDDHCPITNFGPELKRVAARDAEHRISADLIGACPMLEELHLGFCGVRHPEPAGSICDQAALPRLKRLTLEAFYEHDLEKDHAAQLWQQVLHILKPLLLWQSDQLDTFTLRLTYASSTCFNGRDMNAVLQVLFAQLAHRLKGGRLCIEAQIPYISWSRKGSSEVWPLSSLEEANFEHLFSGLRVLDLHGFYALGVDLEALPLPRSLEELFLLDLVVDLVSTGPDVWEKLVSGLLRQCPNLNRVVITLRNHSCLDQEVHIWSTAAKEQELRLQKIGKTDSRVAFEPASRRTTRLIKRR